MFTSIQQQAKTRYRLRLGGRSNSHSRSMQSNGPLKHQTTQVRTTISSKGAKDTTEAKKKFPDGRSPNLHPSRSEILINLPRQKTKRPPGSPHPIDQKVKYSIHQTPGRISTKDVIKIPETLEQTFLWTTAPHYLEKSTIFFLILPPQHPKSLSLSPSLPIAPTYFRKSHTMK